MKEGKNMIRDFSCLKEKLLSMPQKRRIAVTPAQDLHTLEAVIRAAEDGLGEPVLIGNEPEIRDILGQLKSDGTGMELIHIEDPTACIQMAADMARDGRVDCIMKGKTETGPLMKVLVNREKGIRKSDTMSLLAFMESPGYHKVFGITDVGLLTYPDKEQKKAAIRNAVEAFHTLGVEMPKVAVLAAVEKVNPKMKETVEAAEIKAEGLEGCVLEGPVSFDLAMDPEAAGVKGDVSPVAGDADLLAVPDIVSGNVLAKSITVIGGGRTGGVVLGARVPVLLVSRAAKADDKYMSIVLAALIGKNE